MTWLRALWQRGPQRVVIALGAVMLALVVVMVVALAGTNGDDDVEATATTEPSTTTTTEATTTTARETTTTSPWSPREQEAIDADMAATEAFQEAAAAPNPEPNHPALEEAFTGVHLGEQQSRLEGMQIDGTGFRYHGDPVLIVESVRFDRVDGREVALVRACHVTDWDEILVETGHVLETTSGLQAVEGTRTLEMVDGEWKAAEFEEHRTYEESRECSPG